MITIYDGEETEDIRYNAIIIGVDLTDESNLNFHEEKQKVERAIQQGKQIVFEWYLGLDPLMHNFHDQMRYFGLTIGIVAFIEKIYEPNATHVCGVILYRGVGDFRHAVRHHLELKELLYEFKQEHEQMDEDHLERLFSLQVLMEYLHRLGSALPDELLMHVLLNFKGIGHPSKQAELLSANLFPYIRPAVKGARVAYEGLAWDQGKSSVGYIGTKIEAFTPTVVPQIAVLLPPFGKVPYDALDQELSRLEGEEAFYKIIPEDDLNESWYLIDKLIVFEGVVSEEGKRMIDGFIAAGGEVNFRGGGIRTPDLLDPNQTR